jgi:hypothetical protein
VEALRRFGHDVLTTQDAGNSHEAISDEDVHWQLIDPALADWLWKSPEGFCWLPNAFG